jgi:hypothetical protein
MKKADHRKLAIQLFNHTWTLLDRKRRSAADDDAMVHAAHASRHHWAACGTALNLARGEWQVSRVYAVLRRPEGALHHARRSLELCREHGISDFDLAFAYEALARASRVAGRKTEEARYLRRARSLGAKIADADDRAHFERELATIR